MKRLVIGILAHVDSGKTTLSEGLLYKSGTLRKQGRVDHGDSFLDTELQERERGITIYSKQAIIKMPELELFLVDTPGHVDFSPEMERTLQILDYAILVINGTDGIQSHTDTLWNLLKQHEIPTFLFVNKMDLPGPGKQELLTSFHQHLSDAIIDFTSTPLSDDMLEQIAMCHEELMNEYLQTENILPSSICEAIINRKLFPAIFGSALHLDQVERMLECLQNYTKKPLFPETFGARVFKITRDSNGNRLSWAKITGGTLSVRSIITGKSKDGHEWHDKITGLRIYSGAKYTIAEKAEAGMVVAITGLEHTSAGAGLGYEIAELPPTLRPVLNYQVELPPDVNPYTALNCFKQLEEEEPQLHISWDDQNQEIKLQLMGEIQLEILKNQIQNRFNMTVEFKQGRILYQETIENITEGVGHFEPLRHYAEVHLLLEPGERGSGIAYNCNCDVNSLDRNWQRLIMTNLAERTHIGVLTGSPITDMKITLVSGRAHLKHTEGGDFRQATYRAVRQGLMQAKSVLLEPWYSYRLELPPANLGRAIADIQGMDGSFKQDSGWGNMALLTGMAPVSEMQNYSSNLAGYTHGLGKLSCTFAGYFPCHNQAEIIKEVAYNPESDINNTPDSVFCAHGAGAVVKWDQVTNHMHLPSMLTEILRQREAEPEEKSWEQRAQEYHKHTVSDKELLKIFERTYGPIKHRLPTSEAMHTVKSTNHTDENKRQPRKNIAPTGPEYVLVDGYNMIFAWEDLTELARERLELARDRLIDMMQTYQAVYQCELILVFDAYKVKNNPGSVEHHGNFHIIYTKEAETADMYIERVTHQLGKNRKVRVATSDGLIQMIILGYGALRVPARIFRSEVNAAEETVRNYLENQGK